ncbi:3-isopropylmalate dehydratase large subunit [uncultured Megasphaera sp.]|uniref:3-isopropylmalate dehydratase large subunit n=1 Tax=uncultured Megasphaera sp. TaxID=165188 RepID=UPI002592513F|nr:3-isopropylmalate dehydratase large subunit [uncultured Megasphaera sp.]
MGMTLTEKILARHSHRETVHPGDLIICEVDLVLANDITAPPAIKEFEKIGRPVFDAEKIALIPDHFTPNKDIQSAALAKQVRDFSRRHRIRHYYEVGRVGIEHVLLPEQGLVGPGMITVGADSHTCTYGALGGFATGVGSTDLGVAMATGKAWFKVPESIQVYVHGTKSSYVTGKDLILSLIGRIGVDGALYKSLEFTGPGLSELTMSERLTIANMAIECGAKNGIFPVDDSTLKYEADRFLKPFEIVAADSDAEYCRRIDVDLSLLRPVVAFPHLPENTKPVGTFDPIPIDQVVIGSCTNGRLEDLAQAAAIFANRSVHPEVRCIIIPGSPTVYKEALQAGYLETFINAGCAVAAPTCGPCLGGYMGIMTAGERCVSTTNRNFRGRMGHVESEVYLAGPQVAAASAVLGKIAAPWEV